MDIQRVPTDPKTLYAVEQIKMRYNDEKAQLINQQRVDKAKEEVRLGNDRRNTEVDRMPVRASDVYVDPSDQKIRRLAADITKRG